MANIIGGRLYNLGNDYPGDIGNRSVPSGTWVPSSYLDGIYTQAAEGYVTGGWNKYFNTVLPQEAWDAADSARVFPDQYAIAYVQPESAYKENVSAYPSSGIEAIAEAGVIKPEVAGTPSPYIKKSIDEIIPVKKA